VVASLDVGGLFVTFEGIDRSGKSTQARMLCDALGDRALHVREPGGTPVGERVREMLKDPALEMGLRTEALLFAAARAELVDGVIRPALADGRIVVSDRYLDSSLAYQGDGRGLDVDELEGFNRHARELVPDITFLLALDPGRAIERGVEDDRFEAEGLAFQQRVQQAYERLAAEDPARWRRIEADRRPDAVHADILAAVESKLAGVPA
jgi:dTMP kinase